MKVLENVGVYAGALIRVRVQRHSLVHQIISKKSATFLTGGII
jgi:hypothetical protein